VIVAACRPFEPCIQLGNGPRPYNGSCTRVLYEHVVHSTICISIPPARPAHRPRFGHRQSPHSVEVQVGSSGPQLDVWSQPSPAPPAGKVRSRLAGAGVAMPVSGCSRSSQDLRHGHGDQWCVAFPTPEQPLQHADANSGRACTACMLRSIAPRPLLASAAAAQCPRAVNGGE